MGADISWSDQTETTASTLLVLMKRRARASPLTHRGCRPRLRLGGKAALEMSTPTTRRPGHLARSSSRSHAPQPMSTTLWAHRSSWTMRLWTRGLVFW